MDASQCDVASGVWQDWNRIDWARVHRTTCIAKAVRTGDRRGAQRLQRLLAPRMSGKWLAVRRVTEKSWSQDCRGRSHQVAYSGKQVMRGTYLGQQGVSRASSETSSHSEEPWGWHSAARYSHDAGPGDA